MIARVRGPILAAMSSVFRHQVSGSLSTSTGTAPASSNGDDARDDREGREDHLVARLEPECRDSSLERRGAVVDRDAVAASAVGGPALFELGDVAARRGHPAGRDTFGDELELRLAEQRLVDRDHLRRRTTAARGRDTWRAQNRSFSTRPVYGPCLTSRNVVSSSIRNPWPPPKMTTTSPAASSRVATSARSSS